MKAKKQWRSWLVVVLLAVLIALLCTHLFFRFTLYKAVEDTIELLQTELKHSPLHVCSETFNSGACTITTKAASTQPGKQDIRCTLSTIADKNRIFSDGVVSLGEKNLELSVYADTTFMAISSDLLNQGYYGITYDSFLQDLRSIPLLEWVVSDTLAATWNQSVMQVKRCMEDGFAIPEIYFDFSAFDQLKGLLLTIPAKIDRTQIMHDGLLQGVVRIVYEFGSEKLPGGIRENLFGGTASDLHVTATFYMKRDQLLMGDIQIQNDGDIWKAQMEKMSSNGVMFSITSEDGANITTMEVVVEQEGANRETWSFQQGNESSQSISLHWNHTDNNMILFVNDRQTSVKYEEISDGFHLQTDDLLSMLETFKIDASGFLEANMMCDITVSQGGQCSTPEYKNLDQWSLDDFLTLLDGVGSLIGFSFVS